MNEAPTADGGPGFLAFLAFFLLALALWFLMRNMNARMRRMSYRQQAAHRGRDDPQAAPDDLAPDDLAAGADAPGTGTSADEGATTPPADEAPGVDGTGVDGTGVDGTGVDGTGVDGTGVDGTDGPGEARAGH